LFDFKPHPCNAKQAGRYERVWNEEVVMNEERDRFITESMGQCWHAYDLDKPLNTYSLEAYICEKCKGFILGNYDFTKEEDFSHLWRWAQGQEKMSVLVKQFREEDLRSPEGGEGLRDSFAEDVFRLLKLLKA
jgi:hypothetical protein